MAALQSASIAINSSGDNTVVTGVSGKIIQVYRLAMFNSVTTAQTVLVKDGASTTLAKIPLPSSIGGGVINADIPFLEAPPWYRCSAGNNFVLNLSAATEVDGVVQYTIT